MNLLNEPVYHRGQRTVCRIRPGPDDLFCRDGRIPSCFGVEYMGQCSFYHYRLKTRHEPSPAEQALFLGVRRLSVSTPSIGINTSYLVTARDFGVHDRYYSTKNRLIHEETGELLLEGRVSALLLNEEESPDDLDQMSGSVREARHQ